MRPRTTRSDAAATSESAPAAAPINIAVPSQPCRQVHCSLTLIAIGLIALLGAGCQGGEAAVQNQGEMTVEETGESSSEETVESSSEEAGESSSEVKQTLGLITDTIADIQKTETKIAARKEAYASAGDTQGEQKMAEALEIVAKEEASPELELFAPDESGQITPSPRQVRYSAAFIQAKNAELEEKLNEAEYCCGLEPDFLSEDLQEVRAQAETLQSLGQQLEAEQTAPEQTESEVPEQTGQEKAAPQQPEPPPEEKAASPPPEPPPPPKENVPPPPPEPPPPPTG